MKTDNGLAIAFFAVVIGGAVALAIANDITAPLCEAAKIKSMAPDKIEFGCVEFWLNRYQSLIGNFVAAAVAGATVYWAARQLLSVNRQTSIAAATALRSIIREMEEDQRRFGEMIRTFSPLMDGAKWPTESDLHNVADVVAACDRIYSIWEACLPAHKECEALAIRYSGSKIAAHCTEAAAYLRSMRRLVKRYLDEYPDGERALEPREVSHFGHIMRAAREGLIMGYNEAVRADGTFSSALKDAWRQVRRFEADGVN